MLAVSGAVAWQDKFIDIPNLARRTRQASLGLFPCRSDREIDTKPWVLTCPHLHSDHRFALHFAKDNQAILCL